MLNFKIKATENERKDGYSIEVHGTASGRSDMLEHEVYELLLRLGELEENILNNAMERYLKHRICEACDEFEECEHEDD